jgi:DNA repair protein RecN (Recombination protein N)
MLITLRIENFALVDHLELTFGSGLNVLTGETGAGKSIILDAIDAALGGKVSSRLIRTGEQRALVEATFRLDPESVSWLAQQEIDLIDETDLICSREMVLSRDSLRSRSRVNGVLVSRQVMEQLRANLVEITAQGQSVLLGQPNTQRDWLDSYGGIAAFEQRQQVSQAYQAAQEAFSRLETRRLSERMRLQQIDILEFQAKELTAAALEDPDELDLLEQELQRLSHVVELQQQSYQVYQTLYQNDGEANAAADLLGQAEILLSNIVEVDTSIQPILEMVSAALAQVEEAGRQINAYGESLESDPERLEIASSRLRELKQICRKYGPTLADAIAHSHRVQAELAELSDSEQSIENLEQIYAKKQQKLGQLAEKLTHLRKNAAQNLEARLIAALKPLAMEKVQFKVEIAPIPPTAAGADRIAFLFSPNPGEPLQPLAKTASGGEMSRFLLAIKSCFSSAELGTLIFDEIDVGVSGRVAMAIAQNLHQLSQHHQVLCVTHQPLIAAMADRHYRVDKQSAPTGELNGSEQIRTVVRVSTLDNQVTRCQELAQLAGGQSGGDAIAWAQSLLAQAASQRNYKL